MYVKRIQRCLRYLIIISIVAMALSAAASGLWGQDQGAERQPLDKLFEDAFSAVAGVTNPGNRVWVARLLSEVDVKHGDRRLEVRLIPLIDTAIKEVPTKGKASALARKAETLAIYARTSELLGVMRELDDAWNRGSRVLKILVENGDVATAIVLAERESKSDKQLKALIHIVHALVETGKTKEARQILDQVQSIYSSQSETWKKFTLGDYLAAMAHFDLPRAERLAFGLEREFARNGAILQLTKTVAKSDPAHALELALKITDETYRGYALGNVLRATARDPERQSIHQRALGKVDPMGRAYAFYGAAIYAMANGKIKRALEALDQLDAILPQLSKENRAQFTRRAAIRLAGELISNDVNQVFEKMAGLSYGDDRTKSSMIYYIAVALRDNGHYDLGRRVVETDRGTSNLASYLIGAISARSK